jgi:hypothetical protein
MTRQSDIIKHNNMHIEKKALDRIEREKEVNGFMVDQNDGDISIDSLDEVDVEDVEDSNQFLKRPLSCNINTDVLKRVLGEDTSEYQFFSHNLEGNGKLYLCCKQLLRTDGTSNICEDDVNLHLLMASLLHRLSLGERLLLSKVLDLIVKKHVREQNEISPLDMCLNVPIPSCASQLRRYTEGNFAILNNIPSPIVRLCPIGNAYVLPTDCMKIYFCFGLKPHMVQTVDDIASFDGIVSSVWQTKHARKQLETLEPKDDSTHKILVMIWSDGFDPNSNNKNNRGSVHVITFSLFADLNRNDRNLTFVLSVSADKDDHNFILNKLYEDLEKLRQPTEFFDGEKIIKVQVISFVIIQDRPERSACTGFGYHNGKYNIRWGYSTVFDRDMYSCENCLDYRMKHVSCENKEKCNNCFDWEDNELEYDVPTGYPTDLNINTLNTTKITFEGMKTAAFKAYDKLIEKKWTVVNVTQYLKVEGYSGKTIKDVIKATKTPSINLKDFLPPVWYSRFDLSNHIDTIMHLVVLGITQTVGIMLKSFLTSRGKYSNFHQFNHQMANIRDLNLDWCKTWVFGSKDTPFGPWISENTLAFVRIFKCTFGVMELLIKSDEDKEELDSAMFLVCAWYAVFARIFQSEVTELHIQDTQRHIKIFLSALYMVEMSYRDEDSNKKLKMESTSNLCGLRNLIQFMRDYGPLRLYWEGGFKGEGILRYVKPMITQGTYKKSFSENAIRRYYKDRFFQTMLNYDIKNDSTGDTTTKIRYTKFKTYKKKEIAEDSLTDGLYGGAVSLVILKSGVVCISCKENKKHVAKVFETDDENGQLYFDSWITTASIGASINLTRLELLDSSIVMSYGLALPVPQELEQNMFYIITEDWKERTFINDKLEYILPRVYDCKY